MQFCRISLTSIADDKLLIDLLLQINKSTDLFCQIYLLTIGIKVDFQFYSII